MSGKVYVDALNSVGAFEIPAGSRIDIGGHSDLDVGAAFERDLRLAVLLQLQEPCGRQWHGLVELEHGIHVHED